MPGLNPTLLAVQNNSQCYKKKEKKSTALHKLPNTGLKLGYMGQQEGPAGKGICCQA